MSIADRLVLSRQRHLKWKALDPLEMVLMIICGLTLFGFSISVCCDIMTRQLGAPWLWPQRDWNSNQAKKEIIGQKP